MNSPYPVGDHGLDGRADASDAERYALPDDREPSRADVEEPLWVSAALWPRHRNQPPDPWADR